MGQPGTLVWTELRATPTRSVLGEVGSLPTFGSTDVWVGGFIFPPQGCSKDPCPCLPVCARCFCLQGEMAQPLAAASALTSLSGGPTGGPKGRAVGRVVSWDAAVVEPGICQSKPQVTPSHGPRHIFPGFPSIHHFLNKYTQAVFSIPVCDFLELGVPLPPLPGV